MAKQIGPMTNREAIAAIIRACHNRWQSDDGKTVVHTGEYEAADKIADIFYQDGKG